MNPCGWAIFHGHWCRPVLPISEVRRRDPVAVFTSLDVTDVRFPTSRHLDGSDAMNPDPDYSAAYVSLHTSEGESGFSLVFTIGRGNDVQAEAVRALAHHIVGREVNEVLADLGGLSASLVGDSQLRWLGPEKGVMHMAIGAVVNAAWDLRCRREGKPLWLLLSELSPEEIVDLVDFRYLSDALTREEALEILRRLEPGRAERIASLRATGLPAYTTTPGWLGYSDEKMVRLLREARDQGFRMVKLKVGADRDEDVRRMRIARQEMGEGFPIAIDANQRWDVSSAIDWLTPLLAMNPYWIEEPTSPDDVLAHAAIRQGVPGLRVATGEQMQSRILAKQFLQAQALDVLQIDATRVGGVNEIVAMLLLAAKFDIPVCPHAGGVGLCEMVQHFAMFDAIAIGGDRDDRWCEYVDHLHEHFTVPTDVHDGAYWPPEQPGIGAQMHARTIAEHTYPDGPVWQMEESNEADASGRQQIALHTRAAAGHEEAYTREHASIPADLDAALRRAGVHGWRIWRDGQDIFHLVDVEDYTAMRHQLRNDPANLAWQQHINQFLEVQDSYDGNDNGLDLIWSLPSTPQATAAGERNAQ